MLSRIVRWFAENPLLGALLITTFAMCIYRAQSIYYKDQNESAGVVIEQQNQTIKSVRKANEIKRSIDNVADPAQRLRDSWCRDCK